MNKSTALSELEQAALNYAAACKEVATAQDGRTAELSERATASQDSRPETDLASAAAPIAPAQSSAATDLLRRIMVKLREEATKDDPMEPFAYDKEWEDLATEADAMIADVGQGEIAPGATHPRDEILEQFKRQLIGPVAMSDAPRAELLLDNAATSAQELGLLRTVGGEETVLREAVRLNVVLPLERELSAAQAKIDSLMLEYCPDDMTQEQIENWAKHQKVTL